MCKLNLKSLEELQESVCDLLFVPWHGSIFYRRLEELDSRLVWDNLLARFVECRL